LPLSSLLTLSAKLLAATTFGCVVPPVTCESLTTRSPFSQEANEDVALVAKKIANIVTK